MNKIVRENYPASKLPDDLREGIDPAKRVTVTVVEDQPPYEPMTLEEIFASRRPPYRSADEIVASIRKMRDEWMTEDSFPSLVYLDAMAFIFLVEGEPAVSDPLRTLFDVLRARRGMGVTSELTLAEVLAGSEAAPPSSIKRTYLDLIVWSKFLDLVPVSRDVFYESVDLRFAHRETHGKKLKLPDAIHLTTAVQKRCRYFTSADKGISPPVGMIKTRPNANGVAEILSGLAS
jgi:predicted nucleic acid-binding protein